MSNEEIIASAEIEEVGTVDGEPTEAVEVQAETPEPELDIFDYTDVADKVVKLQVDGQEVVVPVKEALAGYQRQADYTRKTQELSEQRKQMEYAQALQEALQNDPQKTLQLLQQQYGDDFNADEVVAKALATGATDLEAVFKQVAFDKVYSKASEANKKLAAEQERLNAKRGAAIVSSSSSAKGASAPKSAPPKTVQEAFANAQRQLES